MVIPLEPKLRVYIELVCNLYCVMRSENMSTIYILAVFTK